MTSNRKRAASPPQPPGRVDRLQEAPSAPRVGKTTALGKRAEKPSEVSERKGAVPAPEPSRSKAPSPRAGTAPQEAPRDTDLPQARRDDPA